MQSCGSVEVSHGKIRVRLDYGNTRRHVLGAVGILTDDYKESSSSFRISEARNCIKIVEEIRTATPIGLVGDYYPLAVHTLSKLPLPDATSGAGVFQAYNSSRRSLG